MNILITGGTDGMGLAAARRFAGMGARLLVAGRNRERGEMALSQITRENRDAAVTFHQADLSLVSGARQLAGEVKASVDRLDILLHSAGGHFPHRRIVTSEGFEFSFALLTLARRLLTGEMLSLLRAAEDPRVLLMAGGGRGYRALDFDNLQGEKRYSMIGALKRAAPLNELLTIEMMRRYGGITFYNYGPGLVRTRALMGTTPRRLLFSTIGRLFSRHPEEAAEEVVELLTSSKPSGFYSVSLRQIDPGAAGAEDDPGTRLWEYLERLIDDLPGDRQPV